MKKNKIAIQGELGAYSHIACNTLFKDAEIKTCSTFEETFKTAFEDDSYKIVKPLENSLAGRVADIHYLLPKYQLQIHGEHFQEVEHNLITKPDAEMKDIKFVRSHAQAIGQCQKIIMNNKYKTIISADTAGSAKIVSESNDRTQSALASPLAGKIYGLDALGIEIEDMKNNTTRFLIMSNTKEKVDLGKKTKFMTTIIFQVKNIPAALYKAMGGFATNNVNMVKLESYMAEYVHSHPTVVLSPSAKTPFALNQQFFHFHL